MARKVALPVSLLAVLALVGCKPGYVNKDDKYSGALLLPAVPEYKDPDGLDVAKGDPVDWKYVEASKDGMGHLRVDVGDLFQKRHGITSGAVTVLNAEAQGLANARIVPGLQTYEMDWEVKEGRKYFIKIEAKGGKSPYQMTFSIKRGGPDPCLQCSEDQICKNDECVDPIEPPLEDCDPECGRGKFCLPAHQGKAPRCVKRRGRKQHCAAQCGRVFDMSEKFIRMNYGESPKQLKPRMLEYQKDRSGGEPSCAKRCQAELLDVECIARLSNYKKINMCKNACGGPCPTGQRCDNDAGKCVKKPRNPCKGVKCPPGERCRGGKCKKIPTKGCDPPCKSNQICDKRSKTCKPKPLGPISCVVIQVRPSGQNSTLLINRGKAHKVAKGDTGSVRGGGRFTITKVFQARSNAKIKKPAAALAGKKSCTINRKKWKQ